MQVRKSLDELVHSADETRQRAMWKTVIEGQVSTDAILGALQPADIDFLRAHNYPLLRTLIIDVPTSPQPSFSFRSSNC